MTADNRLVVEQGPSPGQEYPLSRLPVVIGRLPGVDILVEDTRISRQHARLSQRQDQIQIEDLGSSNGTFVNGERIVAPHPLQDGDQIGLGQFLRFRIHLAPSHEATIVGHADVGHADVGHADETVYRPADRDMTMVASRDQLADLAERTAAERDDAKHETMIGELPPSQPEVAPMLLVTVTGSPPETHKLTGLSLRIGRAADNDIVIDHTFVSRYHAQLHWSGAGYELVPEPEATNPITVEGKPVTGPLYLHHGLKLRLGGAQAGELVTMIYVSPDESTAAAGPQQILFGENNLLTIGRDKENDIVLDAPTISRFHAQVERVGQRYRVRDLRSSNGTFVNGTAVDGDTWLQANDTVRIGPYRFVMGRDQLAQYDESHGMRVEAVGLNKWVRKDLNILQDISLAFQPSEFIVVVGQSGGGKSTLVDAIAGYRPSTHGRVYVNDIDAYANFDAIRSNIGFVPQKDIIHMELSVYQALDYAAQLRMPPDMSPDERHRRIMEVLDNLDLTHRKDVQISGLSGGQQKRVSIGVELLTKPGLFFLDEPTSGLDPGTETALMQLMRRLADQGRTIVLITHATKNVMLADKVVFLARGGYLAWFGPPDEALAYFDQFRTERQRRSKEIEFDDIYNLLDDPQKGEPSDWAEHYQQHDAFRQNVTVPLQGRLKDGAPAPAVEAPSRPAPAQQVSSWRQFMILSARNLRILSRDRASLILMLLTAPLISLLDFILAIGLGRDLFAFEDGNLNNVIISLVVLINNGIMVAGLAQMRELVKEREIYRRERLVNLRLMPYIMSKVWLAALLAVYMAAAFTISRTVAFVTPGGTLEVMLLFVTLTLLLMAGMMLGLFASALAPNAASAPLLLVPLIIPQIVLSGAMVPLPSHITSPASSRWAFQATMAIGGGGSDVAADVCWDLDEDDQQLLTNSQKDQYCNCMGSSVLRESSCNFPGLGQYYDEAVDTPDPVEPAAIRSEPEPPDLPPPPAQPANMNDPAAIQAYLAELAEYNATVSELQRDYQADAAVYRVERELHQVRTLVYQSDLAELELTRAAAIGAAESRIRFFHDDFGWTFVDKSDEGPYFRMLFTTWAAQTIIILALFAGTVALQRRRDV
jgi:ABC transport system ATP-binding/permease protein